MRESFAFFFLSRIINSHRIDYCSQSLLPMNLKKKNYQDALALLRDNPRMKATVAARLCRASYHRVIRRLHGTLRSLSRRGHNKNLDLPFTAALKEYLLVCYSLGKGAGIDNCVAAANSILRCNSSKGTATRNWTKN